MKKSPEMTEKYTKLFQKTENPPKLFQLREKWTVQNVSEQRICQGKIRIQKHVESPKLYRL
jgi:hypothetical protein